MRLDGANWKQLPPQEPLIKELRLLCRDEVALIRDRTALITQLRQALHDYYPAALEAFPSDWTMPAALAAFTGLLRHRRAFGLKGGKRKWEKFLHVHKLGTQVRNLPAPTWRYSRAQTDSPGFASRDSRQITTGGDIGPNSCNRCTGKPKSMNTARKSAGCSRNILMQ